MGDEKLIPKHGFEGSHWKEVKHDVHEHKVTEKPHRKNRIGSFMKGRGHYKDEWKKGKKGEVILDVKDLEVEYTSAKRVVKAVNGVSFTIKRGEALGLVGESGCGKSTIAKAILQILPDMSSRISGGEIIYKGVDIAKLSDKEMQSIRGDEISMIFQDPMTALNPVKKILSQVAGVIKLHNSEINMKGAKLRAVHMLERVGIPAERTKEYPHQFSGGMQQRVEVAIGLSCHPDLLLADEPTTALDVTMQAQVLKMISKLMHENNTALLLITHNLGVVAETCDSLAVLYAGEIVEYGTKEDVFKHPSHPYTKGLFDALPGSRIIKENEAKGETADPGSSGVRKRKTGERLKPIEGVMPEPSELPSGCKFHTRCPFCTDICKEGPVPVVELGGVHRCQCHHVERVES